MSYFKLSRGDKSAPSHKEGDIRLSTASLPDIYDISSDDSILNKESELRLLNVIVALRDKLESDKKLSSEERSLYDEARQKLVLHNRRFCYQSAKRYKIPGYDLDDKVSVAVQGLYRAMESYQIDQNVRFLTYAYHWVNQHLRMVRKDQFQQTYGRDTNNIGELESKIQKIVKQLSQSKGKSPNDDEIAACLDTENISRKTFYKALRRVYLKPIASLDAPIKSGKKPRDKDKHFKEILADSNQIDMSFENLEEISRTLRLANLAPREKTVIMHRFDLTGLGKLGLREVGKILSVSKERARQIEARAIKKLKNALYKRYNPKHGDKFAGPSEETHVFLDKIRQRERPSGFRYEAPFTLTYRVYLEPQDMSLPIEELCSKYEARGLTLDQVDAFTKKGYFCPNKGISKKSKVNLESSGGALTFDKLYKEGILQESIVAGIKKFRELPLRIGWLPRISDEDLKEVVLGWLSNYIEHPNFSRFAVQPETTYWLLKKEAKLK